MRIGAFGGTFDPPHLGHLILAAEACDRLGLERLLWVLTPDPPHKRSQVIRPWQERLELVQAAIAGNPLFELSRVEINRPGPHYAVDTVRLLKSQYPGAQLVYLIGGDSLHDLPTWFQPQELVKVTDVFGVMRRPDDGVDLAALEEVLPGLTAKLEFVQAPLLEIASNQIRQRVAANRPYRYYLTAAVYDIIRARGYYRQAED